MAMFTELPEIATLLVTVCAFVAKALPTPDEDSNAWYQFFYNLVREVGISSRKTKGDA